MSLTKFASLESAQILDIKGTQTRQHQASLDKLADYENYRTSDGYMYVRIRAISSRVNKNHDGWPSVELAGSRDFFDRHHSAGGFTVEAADGNPEYGFSTFVGKPIFVDHHNSDPKKARGVIVDAKFNVLDHKVAGKDDPYWGGSDVDPEHLPPTEVELLLEVDANSFPRLAKAIRNGDLDGFSMGCDVDYSRCSHCGHEASSPDEYCSHILMKGAHHDYKTADGKRVSRKSYENCYGIKFFEISAVFDPADETALAREVRAAVNKEGWMAPMDNEIPPDPVRHNFSEEAIDAHAKWLMDSYGMNEHDALELAERKIRQRYPTPGSGEGEVYSPKMTDYMNSDPNGMPLLPGGDRVAPPVRPGEANSMGGNILDEVHPVRPMPNDPRWSSSHLAENPLPQSFMTKAPDEVDTLRHEQICPICGSDMDAETCDVCGFVQPPKEFDNPDLNEAQKIRQEMKQQDEAQATPGQGAGTPGAGAQPGAAPGGPLTGPATNIPTKGPATASVTNDMRTWTPKVHPKTAARINQVERPVTPSTQPVSNEPSKQTVTSDQTRPVTSAMQTAQRLMATAQRNHQTGDPMSTRRTADGPTPPGAAPDTRAEVEGVGGVDQASNEEASKANAQVDVTGVGGTGVSDVSAESTVTLGEAAPGSDDSGFNKDKNIEAIPTKTFPDRDGQHPGVTDPVTSETPYWSQENKWSRTADDNDKPFAQQPQQGGDVNDLTETPSKGVEPVDPVGKAQERINLYEHATSPANNSGPTKTWTGTDGNGVLRQQDPVTREQMEWGGVPTGGDAVGPTTSRVKAHFIAAIRLAEAEQELGLITREQKWDRVAQLDAESPEAVRAQLDTLARVKTAGLARLANQRQSGLRRLPSAFGKNTAAPHGFERIATEGEQQREPVTDELLDAAVFTR